MSNPTTYKFWRDFLDEGIVSKSAVPKAIKESPPFRAFFNDRPDGAILSEKSGRGSKLIINEQKRHLILSFFEKTFPTPLESVEDKVDSQMMYRNSKAKNTRTETILHLRGKHIIKLNNKEYDLKSVTEEHTIAGHINPLIEFKNICFVENKDVFLKAEQVLGNDFLYIHSYGRLGINTIKNIKSENVIVFSDYDFVGLNEYLNIKSVFGDKCTFHIPHNFTLLYDKYSTLMESKQSPSQKVKYSLDPTVVYIRDLIQKNNRFLEQQILLKQDHESRT
jgi:hypothetical protein